MCYNMLNFYNHFRIKPESAMLRRMQIVRDMK